ncbi:CDP-alcohol phosphatidyltransferase family protein [Microbacterium sp. zg.Y909]|nr:CDP-alcohol phosphatidyltransferase family protein [Microbacterium sp. zg.Y909]
MNRPLGRLLAAASAAAGMGPNAVTALSALVTGVGLIVLAVPAPSAATGLIAAALLVLGFALDSADGQVARLTGRSSPAGEWLDHVVDAGKMVAVHAAVLIGLWRADSVPTAWLLVPLAYAFVAVVLFAGLTLYSLLAPPAAGSAAAPSTLRSVALLPADYGILALSFALWGAPMTFLGAYTLLLAATTAITAGLLVKWFRSLSAAPAAR